MNDLEKDLAIYNAMYGFANELFSDAVNASEKFREKVADYGNAVNIKELTKNGSDLRCSFQEAIYNFETRTCHIEVGTFECTFLYGEHVFFLLDHWKSLAKVKGEIIFTCEEKIDLPLITTITITLDDAANAKKLTKCCASDGLRPVMGCVLAEFNVDTETVNFVASDGHILGVVTTDKISIHRNNPNDRVLRALFSQKSWERICDYAKKNGNDVTLEFYYHSEYQTNDTAVAILGDTRIKSCLQEGCGFPKWQSVMPFYERFQHLRLTKDGAAELAKFVKNDKDDTFHYTISAYEGCDDLYVEYINYDFCKEKVVKYKLQNPATSDIFIGAAKHQMKKFCVNGFWLNDSHTGVILDTKEFDVLLMMPCDIENPIDAKTADERRGFVLHPEEVEVEVEEFAAA